MYQVFIDGSCPKNGLEASVGGWAYIIKDESGSTVKQSFGKLRVGPQNSKRAELESLYLALLAMKEMGGTYEIITDYKVIVDLVEGFGARKANRDMWDQIEPIMLSMAGSIKITHINAHVESDDIRNTNNNVVDKLARQGANSLLIAPVPV